MVLRRTILPLALLASLAVAATATAATTKGSEPVAHASGGGAAPLTPSIVGIPIMRTERSLTKAGDRIDDGNGAKAVGPLRASRRYLIRSYKGAKYLIANAPPPPAEEGSAASFRKLARRGIRAMRRGGKARRRYYKSLLRKIRTRAHSSGSGAGGPVFADGPTAVFSVFTSQYGAATTAVGMSLDTKGALLNRVKTTLYTAIILRNRLVKIVHAAEPTPPPAEAGRAHAHASGAPVAATFGSVMPGLLILLDDEIQTLQATADDPATPAAQKAILTNALLADYQIRQKVNTWWPPVVGD